MPENFAAFADVLTANEDYAASFALRDLAPRAARGLAIVTCMDSRIEPLTMLGLNPGDAKIMRNAGARVTEDVLRTLVLAVHLLGVQRIMVVPHTRCRMAQVDDAAVHTAIRSESGVDTRSLTFDTVPDQLAALSEDVQRICSSPYLPPDIEAAGFVYDVDTGRLHAVDPD